MKFEWDENKHKVSFEEATTVFSDKLAKITFDPDHSHDEHRQILIGHSHKRRLLFVIHVSFEGKDIVRIVSARKATKRERRDFKNV